jgi:hypothetical protein
MMVKSQLRTLSFDSDYFRRRQLSPGKRCFKAGIGAVWRFQLRLLSLRQGKSVGLETCSSTRQCLARTPAIWKSGRLEMGAPGSAGCLATKIARKTAISALSYQDGLKQRTEMFYGLFLRSGKILLQNGTILRNAVPTPVE